MLNKSRVVFCKIGMDFVAVLVTFDPTPSSPDFTEGIYFLDVDLTVLNPFLNPLLNPLGIIWLFR